MSRSAAYLEDVVIVKTLCNGNLLRNHNRVCEVIVGQFMQLLCVVYVADPSGQSRSRGVRAGMALHLGITSACPLARGPMSKKEKLQIKTVSWPSRMMTRHAENARMLSLDELEARDLA